MNQERNEDYKRAFQVLDRLVKEGFFIDLKTNKKIYFRDVYRKALADGTVREFDNREWSLIKSQRFRLTDIKLWKERGLFSDVNKLDDFSLLFKLGHNSGEYVEIGKQLSLSYTNVHLVEGRMSFQRAIYTEKKLPYQWIMRECEPEGRYDSLTRKEIIDPRLCIVFDVSLLKDFGYFADQVFTAEELEANDTYTNRRKTALGEPIDRGFNKIGVQNKETKGIFRR